MKKALIDENSIVAQVADETFGIAPPCFWVDCADDVVAYAYKYENGAIVPLPPLPPPTAEQNKQTASKFLYETDWTTIPDVSDPTKSNPYLSNTQDFINYRNAVRQYALNPVEGYINWPNKPQEVWI